MFNFNLNIHHQKFALFDFAAEIGMEMLIQYVQDKCIQSFFSKLELVPLINKLITYVQNIDRENACVERKYFRFYILHRKNKITQKFEQIMNAIGIPQ